MFVPDKKWNVAYIHVLFNYARQGGERTLAVFMCYGVNIWCVRESPDLFSGGMFVPDKKWNAGYIHVVYSCSMPDKMWRRNTDYIHVLCQTKCGGGTLTIFMFCARKSGGGTLTIFMFCARQNVEEEH